MPKHLDLHPLQQRLQLEFVDKVLFRRALTHCSSGKSLHMERLEFLGDAVLGLVIAEYLHARFSQENEGFLSRMRAQLVRKESLLIVAKQWQLADAIHVGEGERDHRGQLKSPSIAANAVEAIIGAVFKSQGFDVARQLVLREWQELFSNTQPIDTQDAKSRLQEWTQGHGQGLPHYEIEDMGVRKEPRFIAYCKVAGNIVGQGHGQRKKQAEIMAASAAIQKLGVTTS